MRTLITEIEDLLTDVGELTDETRLAIKGYVTAFIYWCLLYLAVEMVIEYYDRSFFSAAASWCSLVFIVVTIWYSWIRGGRPLDALIGIKVIIRPTHVTAVSRPLTRASQHALAIANTITYLVRKIFVVGVLLGLACWLLPMARNWGLSATLILVWIGYLFSGAKFMMEKWRKLLIVAMFVLLTAIVVQPFAQPIYDSYRWSAVEGGVVQPTTSMFARTTQDIPVWECASCRAKDEFNPSSVNPQPLRFKANTMLEVINPEPQTFRGTTVLLVNRQLTDNPLEGFGERVYVVPAALVERKSSLTEQSQGNTPPPSQNTNNNTQAGRLPTPASSTTLLGPNKWRVVLAANEEFHTGIKPAAGQKVIFSDWKGEVKSDPQENFISKPGGYLPVSQITPNDKQPRPFTSTSAWFDALLCRLGIGKEYHDVGGRQGGSFTVQEDGGEILLSINCLLNYSSFASGSYEVTIQLE